MFENPGEDDANIAALIFRRSHDWHNDRVVITQEDVRTAIYSMARGETTGTDRILAETWQAAADSDDRLCMVLAWVFVKRILDIVADDDENAHDGDDDGNDAIRHSDEERREAADLLKPHDAGAQADANTAEPGTPTSGRPLRQTNMVRPLTTACRRIPLRKRNASGRRDSHQRGCRSDAPISCLRPD